MPRTTDPLLVSRLSDAARLLEVGIGDRPAIAAALVDAGADVRATDVRPVEVSAGVRFRVEDLTAHGELDEFHAVDVVYALNCPPELHRPLQELAAAVGADCYFTTLGTDPPAVPVEQEQLTGTVDGDPVRETLYRATNRETTP
ncbi:UPF0146 family protein [Halolamina sp.]|jgi:hypothetical protein|uniref:UPF0146 family protein n=1 Tax=Halolamina sp. TaxID=1940283 RepID=UPI000223BEB5|nr:protein of unknown function UPF0146 [halophilic archaeon DL31]